MAVHKKTATLDMDATIVETAVAAIEPHPIHQGNDQAQKQFQGGTQGRRKIILFLDLL